MTTEYNVLRKVRFTIDNDVPLVNEEDYRSLTISVCKEDDDRVSLCLVEGPKGSDLEAMLPASVLRQLANALTAFADMIGQ